MNFRSLKKLRRKKYIIINTANNLNIIIII